MTRIMRLLAVVAMLVCGNAWTHAASAQGTCQSASGMVTITPCNGEQWNIQHDRTSIWYTIDNNDSFGHQYYLYPLCDGTNIQQCVTDYPPSSTYWPISAYYSDIVEMRFSTGDANATQTVSFQLLDRSTWEQFQADNTVHIDGGLIVSGSGNNPDYRSPALCAMNCFDASYSHMTVPYVTLDMPRAVTLVYREERAHPRPILFADLSLWGPWSSSATFKALIQTSGGSAYATFLQNHSTTLPVSLMYSGTDGSRVASQFDASSYTSTANVFPVTLDMSISYTYSTSTHRTGSTYVTVVSPNWFQVAPGWGIAGVQRLTCTLVAGGCLIADGDGTTVWFSGGAGTQGPDYSKLTWNGTNYFRLYPDSSRVRFTSAGLMDQIIDRLGRVTQFTYDGSGRLTKIEDPVRVAKGSGRYIALTYGSNGLQTIADTDGVGSSRQTTLSYTSGRVTAIADPDGKADTLVYDDSTRLSSIIDRRHGVVQYGYDNNSWKLTSISAPSIPIDNGSGDTTSQTVTTTYLPWQLHGLASSATSGVAG